MVAMSQDGPTVIPVFPLPGSVFFPHTVLPLHVFEPRYRVMVQDAVAGDGRLAIALLKSGHEDEYHGAPPIHPVGTIGRIEDLQPLADGRFLFNLVGEQRVRMEELPTDKPYRIVRTTACPDFEIDDSDPEVSRSKLELLASHGMLMRALGADDPSSFILHDGMAFENAVNGSCANLPSEPEVRQRLLEIDDPLQRQRRVQRMIDRALREVLEREPPGDDQPSVGLN